VHESIEISRLRAAIAELAVVTAGRVRSGVGHDDADATVGTVASDDAIGFDPFLLLRAFHDEGADVAVIGQIAGIMHGSTELTGDLDLLWDGDRAQAPALLAALTRVDADLIDDDGNAVARTLSSLAAPKVQFHSASASGDLCTPALPWGGIPVAEFLGRARTAYAADGLRVRFLDLSDLIFMRRAVGRPKDLRRADELERIADRRES